MTARSTTYDPVPWGRHPRADIPVPPFSDAAAAARFGELLAIWVAVLGGTDVRGYALASLLDDERRARRRSPSAELSPLAMRVAVATFFPAPWTPYGLAVELGRAWWCQEQPWSATEDRISWGGDPDFAALRSADGVWRVQRRERGRVDDYAEVDDDDMVLLLMEVQHGTPYPYGHVVDSADVERLRADAGHVREAWARRQAAPYLLEWAD